MLKETFGEILKETRVSKGITQEDIFSLTGISTNSISALERGVYLPKMDTLFNLAEAMDVEPYTIVYMVKTELDKKKSAPKNKKLNKASKKKSVKKK